MNELPTSKQLEYLKCWDKLTRKHGKAPTYMQLADAMGTQLKAAQDAVAQLLKKGLLERPEVVVLGKPRVSRKGKEWL